MKKVILILVLVFSSVLCFAQNWNCFVPGQRQFFINGDGYLKGIRIDSVKTIGSNTVYYPFHTMRDTNSVRRGWSISTDSAGGSWVGKHIIVDTDGVYYFDNWFRDTIVIHTLADSGDSWLFYNDNADTTRTYYQATVISKDTMSVLGNLDSIKRIQIKAYRDTLPIRDTVNSFEIILSKGNGFVQTFELYTFPFHKLYKPVGALDFYMGVYVEHGINTSTMLFKQVKYIYPDNADMYNYEVGDGYRYDSYDASIPGVEYHRAGWNKVTSKTIVSTTETDYTVHDWRYSECYTCHPPVTPTSYEVDDSIKIGHKIIDSIRVMPEEAGSETVYWYSPEDTSFCFKSPYYFWSNYGNYIFEDCGHGKSYKAGIGLIDTGICYDATGPVSYSWFINGAKKNGIDCGMGVTPMKIGNSNTISVYPNPANDEVTMKFENNTTDLQIDVLNMLGQTVLSANTKAQQYSFSVKNLLNGMYDVRVGDGKKWYHQKLIIQH